MSDIRLEEIPFEFDGKVYMLRCNMNVLADVQEAFGGSMEEAFNADNPMIGVREFLTAMLNDYADEQGWPERWTARQVGRKLSPRQVPTRDVMGLVSRAVAPPGARKDPDGVSDPDTTGNQAEPGHPGN